jgi:hypothetical protein
VTIDLPKRVAENIGRFTGRAWLLSKLLEWWDRDDERLFLLTGGPGSGKSMILAWLAGFGPAPEDATTQSQLARVRKVVKAAHFCQASSRNITPQAFAENIVNQLTSSVAGFAEAHTATLAERVQITATQTIGTVAAEGSATGVSIGRIDLGTLGDELSFDRAFTQPLKKFYASGHSEPMLLLVDALDEAQTYTGVTLPDLLSHLSDLPSPVRILATTREEPRLLKFFRDIRPFDLIREAARDVDDVRTYAAQRLTQPAAVADAKRTEFADRLAKQAGGVFLYAAMVLDELLDRPLAELPDLDAYPLPDGLSGLYHDFLNRELGKDEQRWFDFYEPLLGLIAVGQGEGLAATQLTAIIGKDIRAALRASKQYLSGELPEGPFRPFHKSFADFLLEEEDNVDYRIDAASMHRRIAEHYWLKNREDWTGADNYAFGHLPTHLGTVRAWTRLEELLLDPSFVRALSGFSNEALADAYRWAGTCLEHMSESPPRKLLLQLSAVAEQLRSFTGRAPAIRAIESFWEMEDPQHLLVVGGPGMGKSAHVAQFWVRHLDHCLLAKLNAGDSLRTAFTEKVLHDSPLLQESEGEYEGRVSARAYELLFHVLARCRKNVCIIIDELDAARNVDFEVAEFPLVLPPNLRMIWVSRPIPALRHLTRAARVLDLDGLTRTEVLDFCRERLGARVREDLLERIAAKSDGSLLYIGTIAQQLERGELSERELETALSQSPWGFIEAKTRNLETRHPEMRERLASLMGAIASQGQTAKVRLKDVAVQFDVKELDSIEASGLFVVERESGGTIVGVVHVSVLDFLRQRYAIR